VISRRARRRDSFGPRDPGGVEGIAFVDFNEKDVVRHELVARIVRA